MLSANSYEFNVCMRNPHNDKNPGPHSCLGSCLFAPMPEVHMCHQQGTDLRLLSDFSLQWQVLLTEACQIYVHINSNFHFPPFPCFYFSLVNKTPIASQKTVP